MSFFNIREAKVEDIDEIVKLMLICFSDKFNVIFGSRIKKGKIALIEDLKTRKSLEDIIVAVCNEKIVGVFSLRFKETQYDFFSTLKIFIKHLGVINGVRSIFLGGFLPFSLSDDKCFIDYLGVLPEFRKQGIGKDLITHGEKLAIEKNKKYIFCFINSSNIEPRQLVGKFGFKEKYVKTSILSKVFFKEFDWIYLEKIIT